MKRISKKIKYDFTIYICLILALVLIGYSGYSYLDSQSYSLKDLITPEKEIVLEKEPQELKDLNKKDIINKYLLDIIDEKKIDQILTSESIREWKAYDIMSISYNRKIANNYYSYTTHIKISNINANFPKIENKELSRDKYKVITLNFNIVKDIKTNEYTVKTTDIPKNG